MALRWAEEIVRGWDVYRIPPAFVLGFHGCDREIGEAILGGQPMKSSENDYDWLGSGAYFWQNDPRRALRFAQERASGGKNSKGTIREPFVIGAILNLGFCLDLRDSQSLGEAKQAHDLLRQIQPDLPSNSESLLLRRLDCAVLNYLHVVRESRNLRPYDTVRANFWEGGALYEGAGFRESDHVQICVRNPQTILGFFRPLADAI